MSFTLPKELVERLNTIFPRSEERVKIALSMLGYDHDPSRAEKQGIADSFEMSIRSVELVIEKLMEENLFASDIGSVPLWRFNEKLRLNLQNIIPSMDTSHKENSPSESELPLFPIGVPMGSKVLSEVRTEVETETEVEVKTEVKTEAPEVQSEVQSEVKQKSIRRDFETPIISDVQAKKLDELKARQEGFEVVMKTEIGSIKSMLEKALTPPKQPVAEGGTVVPITSGLKGQVKQPAAEDPPAQPSNPEPVVVNPNDPFANMTKDEVVEFYENNPPAGRKLPGGLSETFVNAPPTTIRKIIIEVTTYTQMLYEKALADEAFDGTFSDFLNWAPAKYFEDRGLSLGWHKVERHPGGRLN